MFRRKSGFTLIELMVVIAIIGMLASIIMVSLGSAKQKSRDSRRIADIKSIQLALSLYYNDNLMYPVNIYATGASAPTMGLAPNYLPVVPKDPNAAASDTCGASNANGLAGCYHYNAYDTTGQSICNSTTNIPVIYHIGAAFEDATNAALSQGVNADSDLNPPFTSATYTACTGGNSPVVTFSGTNAGCNSTVASPDNCYDLTP